MKNNNENKLPTIDEIKSNAHKLDDLIDRIQRGKLEIKSTRITAFDRLEAVREQLERLRPRVVSGDISYPLLAQWLAETLDYKISVGVLRRYCKEQLLFVKEAAVSVVEQSQSNAESVHHEYQQPLQTDNTEHVSDAHAEYLRRVGRSEEIEV